MWKRLADASWLTLILGFGVWLTGWLLGAYTYVPSLPIVIGIVGYLAVFEFFVLINQEHGDTLSERVRKLSRDRPLIALVFGLVGGTGLALAALSVDVAKLRALGIIAFLAILCGHFFVPPNPSAKRVSITEAFAFGFVYGISLSMAAWIETSELSDLFAFMALAVYGVFMGARFFPLKD